MTKPPKIRCAIYTRKSTEEGLEQEFNSLDAQREASEAYIKSQVHEGWEVIPKHYDDGGFSGGNINRPAMQELLADIEAGKVDVVVVYKVDRLSRALNDFARMVEIFDKHNVSFVSVTQQFNTTTSMGRLTLNVLLSFAQFEREVTGERIRDKFAASKKKGMWMGGNIPLGYNITNRKLLVNETEAPNVKLIFEKYLEIRSVSATAEYLNKNSYITKSWSKKNGEITGGAKYTKNNLKSLLSNPIYIGKIKHKDKVYDGEHRAIIDENLWQEVQGLLKENSVKRKSTNNQNHSILFKGKTFDADGNIFTTTYTKRGNKRYHYYLNKVTKNRISVSELNSIVCNSVGGLDLNNINLEVSNLSKAEVCNIYNNSITEILKTAVERVVVNQEEITVLINKTKLAEVIENNQDGNIDSETLDRRENLEVIDRTETLEIIVHIAFRSYAGKKIAYSPNGNAISINKTNHDQTLIRAIARSYKWNKMLDAGEMKSITEIANIEKQPRSYVNTIMRLKFLSPRIVEMILAGTQPRTMQLKDFMKPFPICWQNQELSVRKLRS